jgi:hypothetical protein
VKSGQVGQPGQWESGFEAGIIENGNSYERAEGRDLNFGLLRQADATISLAAVMLKEADYLEDVRSPPLFLWIGPE